MASGNPLKPVVLDGAAELVTDLDTLKIILNLGDVKYITNHTMDRFQPATNACFRLRPVWAFGIARGNFTGSATRWVF